MYLPSALPRAWVAHALQARTVIADRAFHELGGISEIVRILPLAMPYYY
jgi:hypothetical protein